MEKFFAERIFGPMRLDKLARQLRTHQKATTKNADGAQKRIREEIADLDDRIGKQITALEQGIEPQLIAKRIEKLRRDKEAAEIELRALTPAAADPGASEDPSALLARLPDLGAALSDAPRELKRQVFEAFCLQITYDKVNRRIEISATITQAIAEALKNAEDLPEEAIRVAQRDIAGAGFEPATFGL
ncbi:MAG TPA: hypothetical protein VFD31_10510 [Thermoleophilaceae bacterium]|nr:hypothetical protein [Thermoleophilaceae bacterium]